MSEDEVSALKEALCNQYIIMKKLYAELEEEREASATAASEALSMILRLQREKAVEKMESCQFKRMAEEKMRHAEDCLEFLEEVIEQNEMENSSLIYQLEIYRRKLARHGVTVSHFDQLNTSEGQSFTGNNVLPDKKSFHGFIRRITSLPSLLQLGESCPEMDTKYDESGEVERHSPDLKQAEEVNKKLKELMQAENSKEVVSITTTEILRPLSVSSLISDQESVSSSWYSAVSDGTSYDSKTGGARRKSDDQAVSCLPSHVRGSEYVPKFARPSTCLEAESKEKTVQPGGIHDIFEITDNQKEYNMNQPYKQMLEATDQINNMCRMPNPTPEEYADNLCRDDRLNNACMNGHYGNKSSPPRKPPRLQHGSKLSTPSKGTSLGYHLTLGDPRVEIGTSQVDFDQLKVCLKHLENERITLQEDTERCKEQVTLLRNIFKRLNTIETQMKRAGTKKYSAHDDPKVVSVMEVCIWLLASYSNLRFEMSLLECLTMHVLYNLIKSDLSKNFAPLHCGHRVVHLGCLYLLDLGMLGFEPDSLRIYCLRIMHESCCNQPDMRT